MEADLIVIDLKGLDVILGMDWLASNYASMDCFLKEVILRRLGLPVVIFYGEWRRAPSGLISAISARWLLQKGCKVYLARVVDSWRCSDIGGCINSEGIPKCVSR